MNLSSEFREKTREFDAILKKFNRIHSLSNYENIEPVVLDSVSMLDFLREFTGFSDFSWLKTTIDIGSGAGFPAIFLAMILKDCEFVLFEPTPKKSSFLAYVKSALDLQNLVVKAEKIELSKKFRADLITSRAVSKTKDLIALCDGFYDVNSVFALYKGANAKAELENLDAKKAIYSRAARNYVFLKEVKCSQKL